MTPSTAAAHAQPPAARPPRPAAVAPDSVAWRRSSWGAELWLTAIVVSVAVVAALWIATTLPVASASAAVTAAGILAGLIATDLALVMVLLASRLPALDRAIGVDRAMRWHGALGKPVLYLLLAHGALLVVGGAMADGIDPVAETLALLSSSDIVLSVVAIALFLAVVGTSLVLIRRALAHELWWVTHLLSYLAIATAVPHQFSTGAIFLPGSPQWWYWIALYTAVGAAVLGWRVVTPIVRSRRHRLMVVGVEPAGGDAVSLWLAGDELGRLGVEPGQFLRMRFLARGLWWQSHPYSVSAITATHLRITVKRLGRGSARTLRVAPGTRVAFSGPHGHFTLRARSARNTLLIGAGVGVTPLLPLLTALDGRRTGLLVRVGDPADAVLLGELEQVAAARGARMRVLTGPRGAGRFGWAGRGGDPLAGADLSDLDAFICGPRAWADAVSADLAARGMPDHRIHVERFTD